MAEGMEATGIHAIVLASGAPPRITAEGCLQGSAVKSRRGRAAVTGRQPPHRAGTCVTNYCPRRVGRRDGKPGAGIPAPQTARPARIGFACDRPHRFPGLTGNCEHHLDRDAKPSREQFVGKALLVHCGICLLILVACGADPWADLVLEWTPGNGGSPGYDNPVTTLGPPTRITFDDLSVTPFYPAWGTDELVSIGAGGSISLRFTEPVLDHPENPYGIDLLLFGNTGFIDEDYPNGVMGGLLGADGGELEVSEDGETWIQVTTCETDDAWPTMGWTDLGPYDIGGSNHPSDFTRPLPITLTIDDVQGIDWEALLVHYDGSGGGVGVDLAETGLAAICCVRISNPAGSFFSPELDAIADVSPTDSADVNLDRQVDVTDLLSVIASWGADDAGRPDINRSGLVDVGDLLLVIAQWGQSP